MKRVFTKEREAELVNEYLSGQSTLREIADREGCDTTTFHKIVHRHASPEDIQRARSANHSKAKTGIPRLQSTVDAIRAALSRNQTRRTCPICGTVFGVPQNKVDEGKGHYCSLACYNEQRRTTRPVPVRCAECDKEFMAYQYELRREQGKFCSRGCLARNMERRRGPQTGNWKGGKSETNTLIRGSAAYARWRTEVFQRDNYTCQNCRRKGIYLEAHHIKSFNDYPELRFDVSNGISLCLDCHADLDPHRNRLAGPRRRRR